MAAVSAKVPKQYLDEFMQQQVLFVKKRMPLFYALTVAIYFLSALMWLILSPGQFSVVEVAVGILLVVGGAFILRFNEKAHTVRLAKSNAYLFTALILVLLIKLNSAYQSDILSISSVFVFTLFLVSITIPWTPTEVAFIGFMHTVAYTASFMYIRFSSGDAAASFGALEYFDGFIFLFIAFALCMVIPITLINCTFAVTQ